MHGGGRSCRKRKTRLRLGKRLCEKHGRNIHAEPDLDGAAADEVAMGAIALMTKRTFHPRPVWTVETEEDDEEKTLVGVGSGNQVPGEKGEDRTGLASAAASRRDITRTHALRQARVVSGWC